MLVTTFLLSTMLVTKYRYTISDIKKPKKWENFVLALCTKYNCVMFNNVSNS